MNATRFARIAFSHAYQPIVDTQTLESQAYEVLLRGPNGEPPGHVFQQLTEPEIPAFDQFSRERAIVLATKLGVTQRLNLNFFPGSVLYNDGEYLEDTIRSADESGFPVNKLMIELTETEFVRDIDRLLDVVNRFRREGLSFAIDDFGSGYAGLNLLADLQPEQLKLDIQLIRGINKAGPRQSIVSAICTICLDLGITVLAEGVETLAEYEHLKEIGVDLCQGYLLAKPGFESLPDINAIYSAGEAQAS